MRIKHYTLLFAFLAIFMGMPLIQGCSDPFDEHGNRGTEVPAKDGWRSVTMSVEGLGLRNPLTRSLTPEGIITDYPARAKEVLYQPDVAKNLLAYIRMVMK